MQIGHNTISYKITDLKLSSFGVSPGPLGEEELPLGPITIFLSLPYI